MTDETYPYLREAPAQLYNEIAINLAEGEWRECGLVKLLQLLAKGSATRDRWRVEPEEPKEPKDDDWYPGQLVGYDADKGTHTIFYDDGSQEEVDLAKEKYRLVYQLKPPALAARRAPPRPSEAAPPAEILPATSSSWMRLPALAAAPPGGQGGWHVRRRDHRRRLHRRCCRARALEDHRLSHHARGRR